MGIDGAVTCFAPFHNINCPQGFLYFNKKVCIKCLWVEKSQWFRQLDTISMAGIILSATFSAFLVDLWCILYSPLYNRTSK